MLERLGPAHEEKQAPRTYANITHLGILGILFICHTITIITKRCQKKNVGRDGEEA